MRTILVVQGKGGGPKTATVRNLAVAAAVAGRRVGTYGPTITVRMATIRMRMECRRRVGGRA